ncbi:MAG: hypothetical protein PWQ82_476 [Thermosediminibacterales bacterium]|nr:hypothetical protein [Thermosediminibacterales bacterium]
MQRYERERVKKLNDLIAIIKIFSLFLIVVALISYMPLEMNTSTLTISILAVFYFFFFVLVKIWEIYSNKKDINTSLTKSHYLYLLFTIVFLTTIVYFTGAHESRFKDLYLLAIIVYSLRHGKKIGITTSLLSTLGVLFNDFVLNMHLSRNIYLESDIVLIGIFFMAGWIIGSMVETEMGFRKTLTALANRDGLTGLYNHRYFQERLEREINKAEEKNSKLALIMLDIDHFKFYNDANGHHRGDMILKQIGKLLMHYTRATDIPARYGGDEFAIIMPETNANSAQKVAERIRSNLEKFPFTGIENTLKRKLTVSIGIGIYPDNAKDKDSLIRAADEALYKAKYISRNKVELYFSVLDNLKKDLNQSDQKVIETAKTLISIINAKDRYTYGHSERVAAYVQLIADQLQLSDKDKRILKYAAYLHDIGKIEIDEGLLNKKSPLTLEEWEIMKKHPIWGADIIKSVQSLRCIVPFILYHHEYYDGGGYPFGLKGDQIPLGARILSVADSFDAMTTNRPYKAVAKTYEGAIDELQRCSGSQFDPMVVEAFLKVLKQKKSIGGLLTTCS